MSAMHPEKHEPMRDGPLDDPGIEAALRKSWDDPPGMKGFFGAVNHKTIGRRFLLTAFGFFIAGGILAVLMRLQLATPDNTLIGPDLYNQLFTMHGSTMMFLFAVPVMQAMAIYLVPLMVGSRSVAFPRLNAFAFWIYLFGGLTLYGAFLLNVGPDAGWFSYPPLAGPEFSPGKRVDFWAQLITFTELSGLLEAVVVITTVFKLRAPGMSLDRIPLFVWAMLVTAFMILFAMPSVMLASLGLLLDRLVGTHFYNPAEGGDSLLWQHLFWFFGHPEVYFIFVPALGFISAIIPTFARRPMFGYSAIVLALIATGFLSFGLWVHHMFAAQLPELGKSFFTAASMLIAIPTAIQLFCWTATLWRGRIHFATPLLYVIAFFVTLTIGGMTGIMVASVPIDLQLHDTYFVFAHLHYVLIGGAVFPLLGAWYYWFPKLTGRMLSERLGRWQFALIFVGFHVAFFPMHLLGLEGMPRRVYTYPEALGWGAMNLVATLGGAMIAVSVLLLVINMVLSLRHGVAAGRDPWHAGTLEWATESPPASPNFIAIPIIGARDPLWEPGEVRGRVSGLSIEDRELIVTTVQDAAPDHRTTFPTPSIWPFVSAVAVTAMFLGTVFTPWALVWGSVPIAIAVTTWFWPTREETERHLAIEKQP